MANVGYATLTVSPSLRGMQQSMRGQLGAIMPAAGQRAGRQLGQGINAGTRTGMGRIAGAMSVVTTAAGTVASGVRSRFAAATSETARGVSGVGASFKSMGATAGAALAAIGVSNVVRDIGSMGMSIQDTTANLTGLYGNAELATSTVSQLNREFGSSRLGAEVFHNAGVSLGYLGVEGDDAVNVMKNIQTSVDALGGGPAQVDSITSALTKAQNQGNAFNGELNMISEAGFPIFSELQNHLGKTEEEIKSMASQGEISLDDLLAVLDEPTSDAFAKAQDAAAELEKSFKSRFTAAKNGVITQLGEMTTGILDRFAPAVERAGNAVQRGIGALPGIFSRAKSVMDRVGITAAIMDIYRAAASLARGAAPALAGFAAGVAGAFGALLVVVRPVARMLRVIGNWMQNNVGTVQAFGAAIGVATVAWRLYRTAQWAANAAMAANPIGIVVVALAALVAAIVWAYQNSETFRSIVQGTWRVVQTVVTSVVGIVTRVIAHLRDETTLLGGIWQTVWTGIQNHFGIIWGAIVEAWNSGVQIFQGMWDILQGILEGDWQRAWNGAKDVALGAWNLLTLGIRTIGSIIWNYLQTFFINLPQNVGTWLRTNIPVIVESLGEWWEAFRTWIIETTPKIVNQLVSWGVAVGDWLANDMPERVVAGATAMWENHVKPWFEDLPNKITSAFNNVQRFQEWMAEYGPTLLRGLGIAVMAVITGIPALIAGVGVAIVTALGVISGSIVSSLTRHLTRAASEAFAAMRRTASDRASALVAWFQGLPSRIYNALSRVVGQMRTLGRNIITGIINGVTGAAGSLYNRLRNVASNALSAARGALGIRSPSREFRDHVGAEIVAGFIQGITRGQRDVDAAIQGMVAARPIARPLPVPQSPEVSRHQSNLEYIDQLHEIATALRERDEGDFVVRIDSQEIARANRRGQRLMDRR